MKSSNLMSHCASQSNPPKGYGSISTGMKVAAFRSKRLDYWAKQLGGKGFTPECFERANADVIAEWGNPF
jgi:hypothetical protein